MARYKIENTDPELMATLYRLYNEGKLRFIDDTTIECITQECDEEIEKHGLKPANMVPS